MPVIDVLILYFCFRIKQLFCDFVQPSWIALGKGGPLLGSGGKALAAHVAVHALGTLLIMLAFAPQFWWLAICDFFMHGMFDRLKSLLVDSRKWSITQKRFWFAIGVDQELHHWTHMVFIAIIYATS